MQEPQEATQPSHCSREGTGLPKAFPRDAANAASGKDVKSGFGPLSCGGSGFPANGQEVKGLVLRVLEAQSSPRKLVRSCNHT